MSVTVGLLRAQRCTRTNMHRKVQLLDSIHKFNYKWLVASPRKKQNVTTMPAHQSGAKILLILPEPLLERLSAIRPTNYH